MNEFLTTLLINIIIGVIVFGGFIIFWGKSAGWFKKGGLIYEYFYNRKKSNKKSPVKKSKKQK